MAEDTGLTFAVPADDVLLRFAVEGADVQGRLVRLGPLADAILSSHPYPEPVARLLGEGLVIAAMLGAALKFEGDLILQARGDGPVPLLVASYRAGGLLRGYADVRAGAEIAPDAGLSRLMGKGHFAITIDPGGEMNRYQGLVALEGESLVDCADAYFQQSEQIATAITVLVGSRVLREEGVARERRQAAGLMIQHLAAEGGRLDDAEREARVAARAERALTSSGEDVEEAWRRARILLATVEPSELLDPDVPPTEVLRRLYAEDGVRVFEPTPLARDCRCTDARIRAILSAYGEAELADMVEDGAIAVTCAYCNLTFRIRPEELG
ncbi:MAG: Hsp33 family molecular chaperone HslO [Alphaproteobacteria bacterium]|nr:Hsp33 family molecular chaperone HslO [Alphaproteobacteria bacterium]